MPLIIGDADDPHVLAVTAAMDTKPAVLDAAAILDTPITVAPTGVEMGRRRLVAGPGWLRRLAPEGWIDSIGAPGVDPVCRAAAVSALAAIARDERFTWLTTLDHLGGAENKPFQYRRAAAFGVPVPDWIVTTDPRAVPRSGNWVAKALGPGSFIDDRGRGRVLPTRRLHTRKNRTIARVPFVLQKFVNARVHARVVTVGDSVRSATLDATDLPVDWRMSPAGHDGFSAAPAPAHVHDLALAAAKSSAVGYSSQDWIQDNNGDWWFIDLNPAGQWLFLPDEVAERVTEAVASYLESDP